MDADEDVDRRCVDCGGSCRNYDIVGYDDHAYARRMCGRCSLQRQQDDDDDDDDDYEEGKDEHRMCDNCGVICGYLADGVDHACYMRRLCAVCLRRRCCRSCKRRLPDVNFADDQQQTCRVS